jgi:predicted nucleic acid-binding protein
MIVLDTNVISELAKPVIDLAVMTWAGSQRSAEMHATAISEAEILFGISLLPDGRRRRDLERAAREMFETVLRGRVLPFDRAAAESFVSMAAARRKSGRPTGKADLQIAAIARSRNARLIATRNVDDFTETGTPLINPWGR